MTELLDVAIRAALAGGNEILKVYSGDFEVELKDDRSPLTLADKNAHDAIFELLTETELPILSEEGRNIIYDERKNWNRFWMVDPLDGTKEFVKRNGEFTVNIALIEQGRPIAGVIYVPVLHTLYIGAENQGARKLQDVDSSSKIDLEYCFKRGESLPIKKEGGPFKVVGSRSHMSPETEEFIAKVKDEHGQVEIVSMGSSLKICLVAEGSADVYPRFAPTMEWDTAAGHGIALGAGCEVVDHSTGSAMRYNKEDLLNNWFIVSRN